MCMTHLERRSTSANHFAAVGSIQLCTEGTKLWPAIFWWWEKRCFADEEDLAHGHKKMAHMVHT